MHFYNHKKSKKQVVIALAILALGSATGTVTMSSIASNTLGQQAIEAVKNEVDWQSQSEQELAALTIENVEQYSAYEMCEKYLNLLERKEITLEQYNRIIRNIDTKYRQLGKTFDSSVYLHKGEYQNYMTELQSGKYDNLVKTLSAKRSVSVPKGMDITSSQALILEMAKHVGTRWANGEGVSGEQNLRYSQTNYPEYTSDITGETYTVRTDCSGFVYTLLRELGCSYFQDSSSVPNTQTFTRLCGDGTLSLDPRLVVLPFDINSLQPGDIMVASKNERLTRWGTNEPLLTASGLPIRRGHTEVFVKWANQQPAELLQAVDGSHPGSQTSTQQVSIASSAEASRSQDTDDKRVMEVYSWGSTSQVERSFTDKTQYIPLESAKDYNYTYIIRFIGGYDLWQQAE